MSPSVAIVVLGAAVRSDGSPSPPLQRRIAYAAEAARAEASAWVFCSGGQGRHGPSEASVMARGLALSVNATRIILDEASTGTLQSVAAAARLARRLSLSHCVVCTDAYHMPRVRHLFHLLGVRADAGPVQRRRAGKLAY